MNGNTAFGMNKPVVSSITDDLDILDLESKFDQKPGFSDDMIGNIDPFSKKVHFWWTNMQIGGGYGISLQEAPKVL